jgi:transposase
MPQGLQLVIGADSQHSFSVYKDTNSNIVKVYYGMSFYDSASMDKDSFEYKYLLGRLYISGIRVKTLIQHFGFSYPTYKRWGDAIRSGNEERIYIAFSGQGGKHKKLTPDIIAFITHDFGHVYKRNKYSYSKEIRKDIKEVFGKELSAELIRPLLGKLKEAFQKKSGLSEAEKKRIYKSHLR